MKYVVFDLREIARELGAHFSQVAPSEHFAWCDCGSRVPQDTDRCQGCGRVVVWKNSRTWKDKFGSPTMRIREMLYAPEDEAGQRLMRIAGQKAFKDRGELDRWEDIQSVLGTSELNEVIDYCAEKTRGRGLVRYVLNAAAKKAESLPSAGQEDEYEMEVIG